eukprot:1155568-Pelagomonas_calceolata.AAC.7
MPHHISLQSSARSAGSSDSMPRKILHNFKRASASAGEGTGEVQGLRARAEENAGMKKSGEGQGLRTNAGIEGSQHLHAEPQNLPKVGNNLLKSYGHSTNVHGHAALSCWMRAARLAARIPMTGRVIHAVWSCLPAC